MAPILRALVIAFVALAVPAAARAERAERGSKEPVAIEDRQFGKPARALFDLRLGPKPEQSFWIADGIDLLGHPDDARRLRAYLLHQMLKVANGEAIDGKVTAGMAADRARRMDPVEGPAGKRFRDAWSRRVASDLAASFLDSRVDPPASVTERASGLRELAPGAWAGRDAHVPREVAYVAIDLANRGRIPLALGNVALLIEPESGAVATFRFECPLPSVKGAWVIAAGETRRIACLTSSTSRGQPSDLARSLIHAQAKPETVRVDPFPAERRLQVADADDLAKAYAALDPGKLETHRAALEACRAELACSSGEPKPEVAKSAAAYGLIALCIVLVYGLIAVWFSNGLAALLLWVGGSGAMVWIGRGIHAGSSHEGWAGYGLLIVYAGLAVAPIVAALVLYGAFRVLQRTRWWPRQPG
ncbi:MAG TPA: hypothetical protein PLD37_09980 [Usitatibacteraceae bacterium]|nr:hypothetical protein [Usitatibacteraceae bacterium]